MRTLFLLLGGASVAMTLALAVVPLRPDPVPCETCPDGFVEFAADKRPRGFGETFQHNLRYVARIVGARLPNRHLEACVDSQIGVSSCDAAIRVSSDDEERTLILYSGCLLAKQEVEVLEWCMPLFDPGDKSGPFGDRFSRFVSAPDLAFAYLRAGKVMIASGNFWAAQVACEEAQRLAPNPEHSRCARDAARAIALKREEEELLARIAERERLLDAAPPECRGCRSLSGCDYYSSRDFRVMTAGVEASSAAAFAASSQAYWQCLATYHRCSTHGIACE